MPNITKRTRKDGSTVFRFRVFAGEAVDGKQDMLSRTWKPPHNMRPTTAEKEAQRLALLFEEQVRSGYITMDGKTTFSAYAARWMESAELAPRTRENYEYLLRRINAAIGSIPLEKLRADHLKKFYANLREDGMNQRGRYAVSDCLDKIRKTNKLTIDALALQAGISSATASAACKGTHVSVVSANKIAIALSADTDKLFKIERGQEKLSDVCIKQHHTMIRTILASAKRERVVPFNVAAEFIDPPKLEKKEAKYLTDEEARRFLAALQDEQDIRVKSALILDLFIGARRGELCGLSWGDIDFVNGIIRIRRASQYQLGKGIVEVKTKNEHSNRDVKVSQFIVEILKEYRKWWMEHRLSWGAEWKGGQERLFIQDDGRPISPDTINFWLRRFIKSNGLPHLTPHGLRHTFVTLQIASGVDVRTLQARTGHSQASTLLNTYAHALQSAQDNAANALDAMLLKEAKR